MKALKALFLTFAVFLLAACAAPLTVKESSVLRSNVQKAKNLQIVYVDATMTVASQQSWGRPVSTANTEFGIFGDSVTSQAGTVFSKRGVSVVSATVQDDKKPLRLPEAVNPDKPLLVITPTKGKIEANGHATTANYVFSVYMIDAVGKSAFWKATIDTNAWIGQNIVMMAVPSSKYDAAFAEKFLNALADQMQKDGVL
ncbi:MAG: hypothetical protein Q8K91_03255 [Hylemonella sp.]|nr:hypothetical protein [Hylemonella sp.]MDP1936207.1 hypothetical protein [Hylemonella sp.]